PILQSREAQNATNERSSRHRETSAHEDAKRRARSIRAAEVTAESAESAKAAECGRSDQRNAQRWRREGQSNNRKNSEGSEARGRNECRLNWSGPRFVIEAEFVAHVRTETVVCRQLLGYAHRELGVEPPLSVDHRELAEFAFGIRGELV